MNRWVPEAVIFLLLAALIASILAGRPDRGMDSGILAVLGFALGVYMSRR